MDLGSTFIFQALSCLLGLLLSAGPPGIIFVCVEVISVSKGCRWYEPTLVYVMNVQNSGQPGISVERLSRALWLSHLPDSLLKYS